MKNARTYYNVASYVSFEVKVEFIDSVREYAVSATCLGEVSDLATWCPIVRRTFWLLLENVLLTERGCVWCQGPSEPISFPLKDPGVL